MFKPLACVVGNRLFVAKFGWQKPQILTFQSSKAALSYAQLTLMDIVTPETFMRSI